MVTGSLKAIIHPVTPTCSATIFTPVAMADLFQAGALVWGIYKWSRQLEDRFKQLELGATASFSNEVPPLKRNNIQMAYLTHQNSLHSQN